MQPLLSVRNIRKSFRGIKVLEDVSFDVDAGSITALVGSNGAGKSTLVNVITGAIQPDGGEVRLAGRDLGRLLINGCGQVCRAHFSIPAYSGPSAWQEVWHWLEHHLNWSVSGHRCFRQ